jgi:hypothetical protein
LISPLLCDYFYSCLVQEDCDPFQCNIPAPTVPTNSPVTASPTGAPAEQIETEEGDRDINDPSPSAGTGGLGGGLSSAFGLPNTWFGLVLGTFVSACSILI